MHQALRIFLLLQGMLQMFILKAFCKEIISKKLFQQKSLSLSLKKNSQQSSCNLDQRSIHQFNPIKIRQILQWDRRAVILSREYGGLLSPQELITKQRFQAHSKLKILQRKLNQEGTINLLNKSLFNLPNNLLKFSLEMLIRM